MLNGQEVGFESAHVELSGFPVASVPADLEDWKLVEHDGRDVLEHDCGNDTVARFRLLTSNNPPGTSAMARLEIQQGPFIVFMLKMAIYPGDAVIVERALLRAAWLLGVVCVTGGLPK